MIRALWTAATGMEAQQLNMDVIANNLANVNTTGFKKSRADFQELLYQTSKAPGTATSADTSIDHDRRCCVRFDHPSDAPYAAADDGSRAYISDQLSKTQLRHAVKRLQNYSDIVADLTRQE